MRFGANEERTLGRTAFHLTDREGLRRSGDWGRGRTGGVALMHVREVAKVVPDCEVDYSPATCIVAEALRAVRN